MTALDWATLLFEHREGAFNCHCGHVYKTTYPAPRSFVHRLHVGQVIADHVAKFSELV